MKKNLDEKGVVKAADDLMRCLEEAIRKDTADIENILLSAEIITRQILSSSSLFRGHVVFVRNASKTLPRYL